MRSLSVGLLLFLLLLAACSHHGPYEKKDRKLDDFAKYGDAVRTSSGSVYRHGAIALVEDDRPGQVGDVLLIRIDESDSASHDSSTKLDRSSEQSYGLSGALQKIDPTLDISKLFGAKADYDFAGGGRIQRHGSVNAMLPVRVKSVLPNGDLFVEGTKVVVVGEEERHLYVSGIARPSDVRADGSITSSRIADAEIEYTGNGDATDQQRQGWFSRFVSYIWPF